MNYYSVKYAQDMADELTEDTGQKHVVRPFALGNKIAYDIVNVERFKDG